MYIPKAFFSQSKGNQCINSSVSKLFAKEEMLFSDAAAVESVSGVLRAVCLTQRQMCPWHEAALRVLQASSRKVAAQKGSLGVGAVSAALGKF